MTDIKMQQPSISFDKKFKYEVKQPSVIHTTARKNLVGNGLNELNPKKEANTAVSEPNAVKNKKVTFANSEYHIIPDNVTEYQPTVSRSTLFEYTDYMPQDKRAQTFNLALRKI
ncbi:hypothetical protein GOM44_02105, partial [Wolbachia endosymbiont of Atemnus politus]|nr:hypothetical protein [Wolbachia endosymbiont of Atemnus politus]